MDPKSARHTFFKQKVGGTYFLSKKWEAHMTHSHIPPHSYTWPWDARPGRPDPTRPGLACGSSLVLSFKPEGHVGQGLGLGSLCFRKGV